MPADPSVAPETAIVKPVVVSEYAATSAESVSVTRSRSVPALPSIVSRPSPSRQRIRSLPSPPRVLSTPEPPVIVSAPPPPETESSPLPPSRLVVPGPADQLVVPGIAVHRRGARAPEEEVVAVAAVERRSA